jgi:IstB-like ATP binding protein
VTDPAPCVRGEPDAWERACPVRRAAASRPTAERPHGALPPTLHLHFDQRGAELPFRVITARDERASTAAASNLPLSEWGSIFPDGRQAAAVVDRLTYRAHIIETGSHSYRLRATERARKEGAVRA